MSISVSFRNPGLLINEIVSSNCSVSKDSAGCVVYNLFPLSDGRGLTVS